MKNNEELLKWLDPITLLYYHLSRKFDIKFKFKNNLFTWKLLRKLSDKGSVLELIGT